MKSKKGDIWKFKDYENRGLSNNVYFYCRGKLDGKVILVPCIITQNGEMLISDKIQNLIHVENDLIKTSVEEFLKEKYDFKSSGIVSIKHPKYEHGSIRKVDNKKKRLLIEVEETDKYNEYTGDYKSIWIKYNDVLILYPDFSFNDRKQFEKIKL